MLYDPNPGVREAAILCIEIKKSITVSVVRLPNVGKHILINSMKRCHVVTVGATMGLTRTMQEVQLDKIVKLSDCPGVVMFNCGENADAAALRNCFLNREVRGSCCFR